MKVSIQERKSIENHTILGRFRPGHQGQPHVLRLIHPSHAAFEEPSNMNLRIPSLIPLLLIASLAQAAGRLEISVVDRDTGKPVAARMELKNAQGKPVRPKGKEIIVWNDQIVFYDKIMLNLPNGGYTFALERGPEYRIVTGHFTIENFADDTKVVELPRFCDMAREGWYSGDFDVARPENQIELLMKADDLHVVPLITWTNKANPWAKKPLPKEPVVNFDRFFFVSLLGGQWMAPGSTFGLFRLDKPFDVKPSTAKTPDALGSLPILPIIEAAKREQPSLWIDAGAMFARDLPIWIAAGLVDSVQLANRHLERDSVIANEAGGWQRDIALFPNPHGNGRWSQEIYYHLLNCGLRIPPTAGSGSGANRNPVGYNRLYVHIGEQPSDSKTENERITWDTWWEALREGRVSVTNGPLIRPIVEGQLPGHVFKADAGETVELLIALTLSTRDKIRYLEIVKNGRTVEEVSLDDWKNAGGRLPPLTFTESGWFLIRAVTDNGRTYRYATSAPYYVELGDRTRISRTSAQFFVDWTNRRAEEVTKALANDNSADAQGIRERAVQAQAYWQKVLDSANAD